MKKLFKIQFITLILIVILATISFADTGTLKDTNFLNVREQPSTSSNIVTVLPANATFDILSEEGDWYKIKYQNYEGYVSKQYATVKQEAPNTNLPPKANADGIINIDTNLYVLPLINSIKIGTLNANTSVLVVSIAGKWAYVQSSTMSGWIFISSVNGVENEEEPINDTENIDSSQTEENSNSSNEENSTNNENNADSENNDENNINSENDNQEEPVTTDNNENNYPKTMYVNVDAVYIRAQPTTSSNAVASIGLNTPVTVKGEEGEWYQVSVTDGDGYMMKQYLSENKQ